jgi:hypothetical protein
MQMVERPAFEPLSLDMETILAEAEATTGLSDFGDDAFRESMRRLLASLESEAMLTPEGRGMQHARIVGLLVNRLRVEEAFRLHPEIEAEEIFEPLVIAGLARTGTTMLQRMIAADPDRLCLYWWESRHPAPFPDAAPGDRDPRIADAEAEVNAMIEGAPELVAMHPIEAEGPDEEVMLLEHAFFSYNPEAFCHVPSYQEWRAAQSQLSGYRYLKRLLKYLQWQKRQRGETASRWILKAPQHLGYMDHLFEVFPDARVVQTHRDPLQTIPSLASLIQAIRVLGSNDSDPRQVGRQWSDTFSQALARCLEFRTTMEDRFIDVWFRDLMRDPIAEIRRIYEICGLALTPDAEAEMKKWSDDNARDKRDAHVYTLEQFGLTEAGIARDFAAYRERFVR